MKPTAYLYKLPHAIGSQQSRWCGPVFEAELSAIRAQVYPSVLQEKPVYAIDFTKYKLVPLEPTEEMTEGHWMDGNVYKKLVRRASNIEDIKE